MTHITGFNANALNAGPYITNKWTQGELHSMKQSPSSEPDGPLAGYGIPPLFTEHDGS
jgi:hypothetical protein